MSTPARSRTLAVIAGAAVISVGISCTALATASTSRHTEIIRNTGSGPALALSNKAAYPPLTVTSSKKVKHFNADLVDGQSSSDLEPKTTQYTIAKIGDGLDQMADFAVSPGSYEATVHGGAVTNDNADHSIICYLFPLKEFGEKGSYDHMLSDRTYPSSSSFFAFSGVTHVDKGDSLFLQCGSEASPAGMNLLTPITVTLRKIETTQGTPVDPRTLRQVPRVRTSAH